MPKISKSNLVLAICAAVYIYFAVTILSFSPQTLNLLSGATNILDHNGENLRTIYQEQPARYVEIKLAQVPQSCVDAVIATEDRWFWENLGVDAAGLARLSLNILPGSTFSNSGGGSTITQQLIKLGTDRVIGRNPLDKVNESIRAVQLTALMPKEQILEAYLNNAYFGNFIYGIEMASRSYFGKPASELNLSECAYLAGLPQSPSFYNPTAHKEVGIARQRIVLDLMVRHGFISSPEWVAARAQPLDFQVTDYEVRAPHFIELLAHQVAIYQPEIGVINWNLPYEVNTTYDYALHAEFLNQLKAEVSESGAADGAVIVLSSDGAVRVAIGSTQFFGQENPTNWLNENLPGTETNFWDYSMAISPSRLKPYFVTSLTNRSTGETVNHIKQVKAEIEMPDISNCNCGISTQEIESGTLIKLLIAKQ